MIVIKAKMSQIKLLSIVGVMAVMMIYFSWIYQQQLNREIDRQNIRWEVLKLQLKTSMQRMENLR